MPSQITNYKCPNCRAPIHFDADTQNLKCDNCGSTFSIAQIEEEYKDDNAIAVEASLNYKPSDTLQFSEDEKSHLRAYNCPSCGAELIHEETTIASSCPYCNNTAIVPAQVEGALKPDYIIPFKLKKEDAIKKLSNFYKGKPFLPSAFPVLDSEICALTKSPYTPGRCPSRSCSATGHCLASIFSFWKSVPGMRSAMANR